MSDRQTITKIQYKKGRPPRYEIEVDDEFVCTIPEDLLVRERILVGRTVTLEELEHWQRLAEEHEAMERALRWLGRRPYSKKEIKQRLLQAEYPSETADKVVEELVHKGYLNELEYAMMQAEKRMKQQKKGRMWVVSELLEKGISREMIDQVLATISPEDEYFAAKQFAEKRWNQLEREEAVKRKQKVAQALMRRGIPGHLARKVIAELEKDGGD